MPLLLPLFVVAYIGLLAWSLSDLRKPEREVLGGNKRFWVLVVLFGNVVGLLAYVLVGRSVESVDRE
ncbi:MAG: PLDc N-terminal domain-containing protein [Chloroflexi bacterium]|nr:PLDc N-terminal domain-containing protein [Chloroflexota bacterium]MDA1173415.1 PLDc N-terminal domain-containing protein [Chloroflexota bacterium]